jgi:hypothetical protein
VPQEDQPPAPDPQGGVPTPGGGSSEPPPPQANSSLGEVRDYMDWLENQRPPVTHSRARSVIVLVVIAAALAAAVLFWRR